MLDLETLIKETAADPDLIELNRGQQHGANPTKLQNCCQEADPPLGHHNGGRSHLDTTITTQRSLKRLIFWTPRDKQNVQQFGHRLVTKYARRHREEIKDLLSRLERR